MTVDNARSEPTPAAYETITIHFISGTGNTYRASQWLAAEGRTAGAEVSLVSIDAEKEPSVPPPDSGRHLVGLMSPTHGFTAPWAMIKFAAKLPRRRVDAFCGCTRAGSKAGRLFMPGVSGSNNPLIALILWLKGYRVRGFVALDMPSNWTQVHSAFKASTVEAISARAKVRAERFMRHLANGRRSYPLIGTAVDVLGGLALVPVSLLYLLVGRVAFAKMFHANNKCNGCGACVEHCPVGGVKMVGTKRPMPYWTYRCESCNRCMAFCARKAIEASYPLAFVVTVLTLPPFVVWLGWPHALAEWVMTPVGFAAWLTIAFVYSYAVMLVSYALLHRALKVRWINAAFTYTNLTHLYRRYREPGTRLKNIAVRRPLADRPQKRRRQQ